MGAAPFIGALLVIWQWSIGPCGHALCAGPPVSLAPGRGA
jgi:hypothetical protein